MHSGGCVRWCRAIFTGGNKTDVTLLTSNLLKAASDSSSPALLRKSNKTMETVYAKMENEESVELAHEKEMDQVYRSRIETLNTKFNATVRKEKEKRKRKQELAKAVYVNGTDATSRVIRKIKKQINKIKQNARKQKKPSPRNCYSDGSCIKMEHVALVTLESQYLISALNICLLD